MFNPEQRCYFELDLLPSRFETVVFEGTLDRLVRLVTYVRLASSFA